MLTSIGAVAQFANAVFEFGRLAMRVAQAEIFVDFEMQLDEELTLLLKRAQIVNREAHALGDGADGFEQDARPEARAVRREPLRRTARFRRCVFRWRR